MKNVNKDGIRLSKGNVITINICLKLLRFYKIYSIVTLLLGLYFLFTAQSSFLRHASMFTLFFSLSSFLFCKILDRFIVVLIEDPYFFDENTYDELERDLIETYGEKKGRKRIEKICKPIDIDKFV